eukprot:GGOE01061409.1.p1 GENE.GGOE01061409.1~~GGOE01061409.1.p1  ORF type:complete len:299 (+),score=40.55 GGOE01061409.1:73-969(+)
MTSSPVHNGALQGLDDASSSSAPGSPVPPPGQQHLPTSPKRVAPGRPEPQDTETDPPQKAKRTSTASKPRAKAPPPSKGSAAARKSAQAVARAKGKMTSGPGKPRPQAGRPGKAPTPLEMYLRKRRPLLREARPDLDGKQLDQRMRLEWVSLAESERQPYKKASEVAMRRWKGPAGKGGSTATPAAKKRASKSKALVAAASDEWAVDPEGNTDDRQRWLYKEEDQPQGAGLSTEDNRLEVERHPQSDLDAASHEGSGERADLCDEDISHELSDVGKTNGDTACDGGGDSTEMEEDDTE